MLSDEVWRAIKARPDLKPKEKRGRLYFRCPRHDDNDPSAWTAGGAWGCFACGFEESITTLATELGIPLENDSGCTLSSYADEKGFSASLLRSWGLETVTQNGEKVVRIPYFDEDGNELRARFRSKTGKWWEGRNRPIYLYGRDHLTDVKRGDAVLIVEGESDCHALWSEGIAAVGVPGATAWRDEWSQYLQGCEIYIWEEPDQGGAQMVRKITKSFPDARIVRSDQAKDPCELRRKLGDDFRDEIRRLASKALPYGAPEPPVVFDKLGPDRFEKLLEHHQRPVDAVPTPFPSWNRNCRDEGGGQGLARGWHLLAAARTGTGKSILALNMAAKAMRHGDTVCFISLEMSQTQVETRLMAIVSGVPVRKLEQGSAFDEKAFSDAARKFDDIPGSFFTNRSMVHSVEDVVRSIRAMFEIHGSRYFIVDYLQLAANPNDPESITQVSHAVRKQAKDLRVITFGLSQFNRATSTLDETPTVHGLMGGSSLENDSDQIVLIDHSMTEESTTPGGIKTGWETNLLLAKNRHGGTGAIPMHFNSKTLQMRELMDDEIPDRLVE